MIISQPEISVIIPIYNMEKYIDRCCDSLLAQKYTNFEVILVDDGSSDNSSIVCKEWCKKDNRFSYYYKENGGLGDTRNFGVKKAKGVYVTFCDPDDWLDKNCYSVIENIINKEKPDIINFGYYNCYNGEPKDKVISYIAEGMHLDLQNTLLPDFVSKSKIFNVDFRPVIKSACMHLYRLDLLNENHIIFKSERDILNEDFLFNLEVILFAKTYYCCHQAFYYYDTVGGSLTQRHIASMYERKKKLKNQYIEMLRNVNGWDSDIQKRIELFWIESMYSCVSNACRKVSGLTVNQAIHELNTIYKDDYLKRCLNNNRDCSESKKGKILLTILRTRNSLLTYFVYKVFVRR